MRCSDEDLCDQIPNGATNSVRIGFEWSRDNSLSVEAQGGEAGAQRQDAELDEPAASNPQVPVTLRSLLPLSCSLTLPTVPACIYADAWPLQAIEFTL